MTSSVIQPRILLVEDNEDLLDILHHLLARRGHVAVDSCTTAEAALAKMEQQPYGLVITDINLPGMDGWSLIETARPQMPTCRFIVITAYGSSDVAVRAGAEADGYLPKPFSARTLHELIRSLLDLPESPQVLVVEDDERLRSMYSKALRGVGFVVDEAATLDEASALLSRQSYRVMLCEPTLGNSRIMELLAAQQPMLTARGTRLILLSGDDRHRALSDRLGADYFLVKPVAIEPLVGLVRELADKSRPVRI